MIRVLLADDQAMIRSGLRELIESDASLSVVAEATDGAEAFALTRAHHPDIVVMDVRMPGVDGVAAITLIRGDPSLSSIPILVLTTYDAGEEVVAAVRAGANGFLGKAAEFSDLQAAIKSVAAGSAFLSPSATKNLMAHIAQPSAAPTRRTPPSAYPGIALLTDREREVVRLVARGWTNDDIASHLYISPLTAKTHVNRSMTKIGVSDRAQLVVAAMQDASLSAPSSPGTSTS